MLLAAYHYYAAGSAVEFEIYSSAASSQAFIATLLFDHPLPFLLSELTQTSASIG